MITRRGLLGSIDVAALVGGWSSVAKASGRPLPLGVQLWSVNVELDRDFTGTLGQLAQLGFRQVETAGLHGRTPAAFRAAIQAAGLESVSAHYSMPDLFADAPRCIDEAKAIGARWLVASSPRADRPLKSGDWIAAIHDAMTLDAWQANAAKLNALGRMAKKAGMSFAYHNHPIEFDRYEGQRGFDVLIAGTDPALVQLEIDIAWAVAGGADPIELLAHHGHRIRLIHAKGLKHKPPPGRYGDDFATGIVGQDDVIDWRSVMAAARKAGVDYVFVEQEPPHLQPIMESLAACRTYLEAC